MPARSQSSTTASIFAINPVSGVLSSIGASPALLATPHSVDVHPAGRFLFAANTASSALTVTGFTANPATGLVSGTIGNFSTGDNSFHVRFDISGRFLYVPNKNAGSVSAFSVNQSSGVLTPAAGVTAISGPHQVALTGVVQ